MPKTIFLEILMVWAFQVRCLPKRTSRDFVLAICLIGSYWGLSLGNSQMYGVTTPSAYAELLAPLSPNRGINLTREVLLMTKTLGMKLRGT